MEMFHKKPWCVPYRRILIITQIVMYILWSVLILCINYTYFSRTSLRIISQNKHENLGMVSDRIDTVVDSATTISNLLARNETILGTFYTDDLDALDLPKTKNVLDTTYIAYYESFSHIDISFYVLAMGSNGYRYSSKAGFSEEDYRAVMSYSWFSKSVANKETHYTAANFIDPTSSDAQSNRAFSVIRHIYDQEDAYLGSVLICVPESNLFSRYQTLTDSQSELYVINDLSVVISSSDKETIGTIPFATNDYQFARDDQGLYHIDSTFFTCKYQSPNTGWTVLERIPISVLQKPIADLLLVMGLITACLAIIAILITTYTAQLIIRPLDQFCQRIQNYKKDTVFAPSHIAEINTLQSTYTNLSCQVEQLLLDARSHEQRMQQVNFDFLRAQISPHFLYNTLFSIKCTVAMGQNDHAQEMIEILISLLRNSISKTQLSTTLLTECSYLSKYIKLQNYRYENNLQLHVELPQHMSNQAIPRFLLQPIVENSIMHGMPANQSTNTISLAFENRNGKLYIRTWDDGSGITPARLQEVLSGKKHGGEERAHIGLLNIQERIVLAYGGAYGLQVEDISPNKRALVVILPLEEGGEHETIFDC